MASAIGILPVYTPSPPAPSYSRKPHSNESSLEYTPLTRQPIQIPDGAFTKKSKRVTLVLHNQHSDAATPVYGPHLALVSGELIIHNPERVVSVQLHLHGMLDARLPEVEKVIRTLNKTETLYKQDDARGKCPDRISFAVVIPTTYNDPSRPRAINLPPTFETPKSQVLKAHVKSEYAISVTIDTLQRFAFFTNTSTVHVPFIYEIRDRPRHPPVDLSSPPLESLKGMPEEWNIATCTIGVKRQFTFPASSSSTTLSEEQTLTPIQCQLVLPSKHVFAFSDRIPFHLELYSDHASESLGGFFGPGIVPLGGDEEPVRLSIVRQVHVSLRSENNEAKEGTRHFMLGNAVMRRIPPKLDDGGRGVKTLDWEGEILVDMESIRERMRGGFECGMVSVTDFIVLNLTPWCPRTSPFETCKRLFPIKLVTDPWGELGE